MKRRHLFEFEDQRWFPAVFRNIITDSLGFGVVRFKFYAPIIPLLKQVLERTHTTQIVDLCSGGAGPWAHLQPALAEQGCTVTVTLTDKFPNLAAFKAQSDPHIQYSAAAVDAADVPPDLDGMLTIFTAFHHFKPDTARQILQNAVRQKRAIGVFEFTERTPKNLMISPFATVLGMLLTTPFIKPFRFTRIFWTYLIPIPLLVNIWDGIVSALRTYSVEELETLVKSLQAEDYHWQVGRATSPGSRFPVVYLIGYPR